MKLKKLFKYLKRCSPDRKDLRIASTSSMQTDTTKMVVHLMDLDLWAKMISVPAENIKQKIRNFICVFPKNYLRNRG